MTAYLIGVTLTAGAVLLLRAIARKHISPRACYALWLVLALRLCLPFSIDAISLPSRTPAPDTGTVSEQIDMEVPANNAQTHLPSPPEVEIMPPSSEGSTALDNTQNDAPSTPPLGTATPNGTNNGQSSTVQAPVRSDPTDPTKALTFASILIAAEHALPYIWGIGSLACLLVFCASYTVFLVRAHRDRVFVRRIHRTKVYSSASVVAPCLAGVIPAVYLTPEIASSKDASLVMIHEYTHLRHGDPFWSLLRTAACIVFWWHPLIWASAILSAHDAELACDDAISAKVDTKTRLRYATLLVNEASSRSTSHRVPVSLAGGQMKERIARLCCEVPQKKNMVGAVVVLVLCVVLSGCTMLGIRQEGNDVSTATHETSNSAESTPLPPDEAEIKLSDDFNVFYREAMRLYAMFTGYNVPQTDGTILSYDGVVYEKVTERGFETMDAMKASLLAYFTEALTDTLLARRVNGHPLYIETNGALYRFGGYAALFGYDSAQIDSVYAYTIRGKEEQFVRISASMAQNGKRYASVCEASFMQTDAGLRFSSFSLPIEGIYDAFITDTPVNAHTIEESATEENRMICIAQYGDAGGYVATSISRPENLYRTKIVTETDGVRYFVFKAPTKQDNLTVFDYITYRVETKDLAIVSCEPCDGLLFSDVQASGTPLASVPIGVYTGKTTINGTLCTLRIAINDAYEVHIEQRCEGDASYTYRGRVSLDKNTLIFTDGTLGYTSEPGEITPYPDMRVRAVTYEGYLFWLGETDSDFFSQVYPLISQKYEEPPRPTPTWQAGTDGSYVAYFADGTSDYIDIYTEENGTYVGSIPYAVLRNFPATGRVYSPSTVGFVPYMHIWCEKQGDFIWVMLATEPVMLRSNIGFCYSEDGGNTWRIGAPPSASGIPTDVTFLSEEVGFLMTYTGNQLPLSIYKTVDGGRTWANCNISYTSEDEATLLRIFRMHGFSETLDSVSEYMGHLRLDAPTFVGNGIGEARLHLIGYDEQEIASLLLATHDAGETWTLDRESLVRNSYPERAPSEENTDGKPLYYAEKWVFYYDGTSYDMREFGTTDAVTDITPVGKFLVVKCHVNPDISLYGIFDTVARTFVKSFAGEGLTWYHDDITTAVYAFWSELYTYDGTLIKAYTLEAHEWIRDIAFSEDHRKIIVTIDDADANTRTDTITLDT